MARLLFLALVSVVVVAAALPEPAPLTSPTSPDAPSYVGTLRGASSVGGPRGLAEADASYPHVRDTFSFEGPVRGVGHVQHSHDVVFRGTTAFLDDWVAALPSARCSRGVPRSAAPGTPMLPGEAGAPFSRQALTLSLTLPPDSVAAFTHRFSRAAHVVIGSASLPALPPACAALLGHTGSTYAVDEVHAQEGAAAATTVRLLLSPAPLLAGFASAQWKHVVRETAEPTTSPPTTHSNSSSSAAAAGPRSLPTVTLFSDGLNWAGGAVTRPTMPLYNWSSPSASSTLEADCINCYIYATETVDVELAFCAYARLHVVLPRVCVWFACLGPVDIGMVGLGPVGVGCDGTDATQSGPGFHLAFSASQQLTAGLGAGLVARAAVHGDTVQPSTRLGLLPSVPLFHSVFMLLGLPVDIAVSASLSASLYASGTFSGVLNTGSVALAGALSSGFTFDTRAGSVVVPTHSQSLVATRTPPSLQLVFGPSSLYVDVIPALSFTLYGCITLDTEFPVRLQADFAYVAPDAVACDLPLCALPALGRTDSGHSLSVYATWQPRVNLSMRAVRMRDIVGEVPLVGSLVAPLVSSSFVLVPQHTLLYVPFNSRQLIYAACWPSVVSWQGGRRALAAVGGDAGDAAASRRLMLRLQQQTKDAAAPPPSNLLLASPGGVVRGGVHGRSLFSNTCGQYAGGVSDGGGWWSGTPCSISGCIAAAYVGGASCTSNYNLNCNSGSYVTGVSTLVCNGGLLGLQLDGLHLRERELLLSPVRLRVLLQRGVAAAVPPGQLLPGGQLHATVLPLLQRWLVRLPGVLPHLSRHSHPSCHAQRHSQRLAHRGAHLNVHQLPHACRDPL